MTEGLPRQSGARLIALYRKPADEAAFLSHYQNVHRPLVMAIPHLRQLNVSRVTQNMVGGADYFLMAEMSFDSPAQLAEAMASPENRAAGADLRNFAAGLVTIITVEDL